MDVPGVEDGEDVPAEVVMDAPGVEDSGGAPGVVVLGGGVLVDVWEVCTTGDIVLDDPTFVIWSGVAEGLIFEGEGATVVVLWPGEKRPNKKSTAIDPDNMLETTESY